MDVVAAARTNLPQKKPQSTGSAYVSLEYYAILCSFNWLYSHQIFTQQTHGRPKRQSGWPTKEWTTAATNKSTR